MAGPAVPDKKRTLFFALTLMVLSSFSQPGTLGASPEADRPDRARFAAAKELRALVLHSYRKGVPWTDGQHEGIEAALRESGRDYALSTEYLDAAKVRLRDSFGLFERLFSLKYGKGDFDLLFCTDDEAYLFLKAARRPDGEALFPGVPLFFSGLSRGDSEDHLKLTTGVLETVDLKGSLELLRSLHPRVRSLVLLADGSPLSAYLLERARREGLLDSAWWDSVSVVESWSEEELPSLLGAVGEDSAGLLFSLALDKNGTVLSREERHFYLREFFKGPVYSLWDYEIGDGVIGGSVVSGREQGAEAASIALNYLADTSAPLPEPKPARNVLIFDFKEMQRFAVNRASLPAEAQVLNEPESLLYLYRFEIFFVLIVSVLETGLILVLIVNISRRRKAEKSLSSLNADLERLVDERTKALRESLDDLTKTQRHLINSEKLAALGALVAGVAHEVNTPLGVGITAASFLGHRTDDLSKAFKSSALSREDLGNYLDTVKETSQILSRNLETAVGHIQSFRQIAVDQNSEVKRRFHLKAYLENITTSLKPELRKAAVALELSCPEDLEVDSYPGALSQILTNLVLNALIHAFGDSQAEKPRICLEVEEADRGFLLRCKDNGVGIPPENRTRIFEPYFSTRLGEGGSGLGLSIVFNLVTNRLGGTIQLVDSDRGSCFEMLFPLDPSKRD